MHALKIKVSSLHNHNNAYAKNIHWNMNYLGKVATHIENELNNFLLV